jgi:hypothetical protein
MSNKSKAASSKHNAELRAGQIHFIESGGAKENVIQSSSIRFRRIEVIDGKKYRVFS